MHKYALFDNERLWHLQRVYHWGLANTWHIFSIQNDIKSPCRTKWVLNNKNYGKSIDWNSTYSFGFAYICETNKDSCVFLPDHSPVIVNCTGLWSWVNKKNLILMPLNHKYIVYKFILSDRYGITLCCYIRFPPKYILPRRYM